MREPIVTLTRVLLLDLSNGAIVAERRMVPLVSTDGRVKVGLRDLFPEHAAECHELHGAIEVSARDRFVFPRGAAIEWFHAPPLTLTDAHDTHQSQ